MKKKSQILKIKNDSNEFLLQIQMLKQLINQPAVKENKSVSGKNKKEKTWKIEARA